MVPSSTFCQEMGPALCLLLMRKRVTFMPQGELTGKRKPSTPYVPRLLTGERLDPWSPNPSLSSKSMTSTTTNPCSLKKCTPQVFPKCQWLVSSTFKCETNAFQCKDLPLSYSRGRDAKVVERNGGVLC